MTRYCELASVALLLYAFTSAIAAPTPPGPTVVFVGDYMTTDWAANSGNPAWVFDGEPAGAFSGTSSKVAAGFQANVVAAHANVVHIMVGVGDEGTGYDSTQTLLTEDLLTNLQTMVAEAKAANIKVILALEPGGWSPENAVVAAYGAANNILVLGYENVPMVGTSIYDQPTFIPTPAGYAQMNQIVTAALATLNTPIQGGYLQNVMQQTGDWDTQSNVNTWEPGAIFQFTAVGYTSGGVIYPQMNSNIVGATGTWTSSNPLVVYIGPTGMAWSLTPGTAIIRYTSLNGVAFSEWIMYITEGVE